MSKSSFNIQIRHLIICYIFYSYLLSITAVAEVAYVAVGDVQLKYKTEETDEQANGICELWNALLTERLSGFESVNIVERENLSVILRELELSLSALSDPNSFLQVQKLIGADYIVLSELTADRSAFILFSRLVSVKDGSVEKDFNIKIDVNNIHGQVDNTAAKIKESVINHLNTCDITHLIAITDFENNSMLSRNDWMETSVSRRLRKALSGLAGIRILEREEVDLLLKEVRLSKGGFVQKAKDTLEENGNCKRRFLITGSYDEYQPLDENLRVEFSINIRDIELQKETTNTIDFEINELERGLTNIYNHIADKVLKTGAEIRNRDIIRYGEKREDSEAESDLDKALRCLDDEGKTTLLYLYENREGDNMIKDYLENQFHHISDPDNRYVQNGIESQVYLNKALDLMKIESFYGPHRLDRIIYRSEPNKITRLTLKRGLRKLDMLSPWQMQRIIWGISSEKYFSFTRIGDHYTDRSPARHAKISRAVQYLKTAIMLDGNNVAAKELLCVLLVDPQISNFAFAKELAQEIVTRFPHSKHQENALLFLLKKFSNDKVQKQYYIDLLVKKYPGNSYAQQVIDNRRTEAEKVEVMRKGFQKRFTSLRLSLSPSEVEALRGATDAYFVDTQMSLFFRRAQNSTDYVDFGEKVVKEMVHDFPQAAILICTRWAYCWNQYNNNTEKTIYWCRRGLELFKGNDKLRIKFGGQYRLMKFMLGEGLVKQGEYELALDAFANIKSPPGKADRIAYLRCVCLYETGRYEEALNGFKTLSAKNKLVKEWIRKCHKSLGIPEQISSPTKLPSPQNWKEGIWTKPPKTPNVGVNSSISALTLDGDDIWMGCNFYNAKSYAANSWPLWIERNMKIYKQVGQTAGLVRYNIRTKKVTQFVVGKEISIPFITCVHAQEGYVWVGTNGGGIDFYDKKTNTWSNISENDGLPSDYIYCFAADDSYLWIGAGFLEKGTIARLDLKTKNLHTFLPGAYRNQASPPTCQIIDMEIIGDYLWCALQRNGITMYDKKKNHWTYYYSGSYFDSVANFKDRVWFSSSRSNKLWNCKSNGDDWQSISLKNDLAIAGVYTMEAYGGRLFLGTSRGPHSLIITNMDGEFDIYRVTSRFYGNNIKGTGVVKILPLSTNEIWLGLPYNGNVKILKIP